MSLCVVTGNLHNILGATAGPGFVTFALTNYGSAMPRILGTSILVSTSYEAPVAADGSFSVQIQGNDTIDPAGTLYAVTFTGDDSGLEPQLFQIMGAAADLNTAVPIGTPATPAFMTGNLIVSAIDNIIFVDGGTYPTITSAFTALGTSPGEIIVPPGTYAETGTIRVKGSQTLTFRGNPTVNFTLAGSDPAFIMEYPAGALVTPSINGNAIIDLQSAGGDAVQINGGSHGYFGAPSGQLRFMNVVGNLIKFVPAGDWQWASEWVVENVEGGTVGGDLIQFNSGSVAHGGYVNTSTFKHVRGDSVSGSGVHFIFASNNALSDLGFWDNTFINCVTGGLSATLPAIYIEKTGSTSPAVPMNMVWIAGELDTGAGTQPWIEAGSVDAAAQIQGIILIGGVLGGGTSGPVFGPTLLGNARADASLIWLGNGGLLLADPSVINFIQAGGDTKQIAVTGHDIVLYSGYGNQNILVKQGNTATSGGNYVPMSLRLRGSYWTGSVAADDDWSITEALGAGANPTSQLQFAHNGSSGAASVTLPNTSALRLKANQGTAYSGADSAIVPNAVNGAGGWGTGAAVSAAAGYDQAFSFTVTAAGTPGADPTIVITAKDGTWTVAPKYIIVRNDNASPSPATFYPTWVATPTTLTITMVGTPTAGQAYTFTVLAIGN